MEGIIIFLKNPEKGKVKTRLAASIGDDQALEVYNKLVEHTLVVVDPLQVQKYVFYDEELGNNSFSLNHEFKKYIQKGRDLGEKMSNAFKTVFAEGVDKAIIIGSDCPEITTELISRGFSKLNENDIVIGPASDGGYYLLGMKKLYSDFFINKEWSSTSVLADTVIDVQRLDLSFYPLPVLSDIDVKEDLERWQMHLSADHT